ncbi:hypothetical protein [Dendronalium sp. ChiSLP03b]|uniref:WD40 repeat domain-containing protein n=1 Tax=Dendronalium sp. ChiSLP03b TaxID=3075381 RepID=UPI002AD50943|nr:hypothetical protein [Dendronalium sp. ChiSLP03b]MDZ8208828.1 hypothetical protein [Dendronalium sp. ChiSLP03b]
MISPNVAIAPDGQLLASGSDDRFIKIWDLKIKQEIGSFYDAGPVWAIAITPDGQTFVSNSSWGGIEVWC